MSIRLEMIEAAARGVRTLTDATPDDGLAALTAFVLSRHCDDGGFRGRGDRSDLYYTTFAVQTLCAMGRPLPETFRSHLAGFQDLPSLGLINLCCLIRCWACLGMDSLEPAGLRAMREAVYSYRSGDGGFAIHPGLSGGSVYGCFLALSALQDLDDSAVAPGGAVAAGMVACVLPLRRPEGGFANESSVPIAMAPSTAAAITVLTQTAGEEPHRADVRDGIASGAEWLRSSRCADGGFAAVEGIDSDLLSTATTLHALASRDREGADAPSHRDLTRKYVLGLREGGGFCGGASDRTCDCEYTFYGLLALGHL